jgi:hypothetical protein
MSDEIANVDQQPRSENDGGSGSPDPDIKADVVPSGAGFQAVHRTAAGAVWSCPHVHFTTHSALACGKRYLDATRRP